MEQLGLTPETSAALRGAGSTPPSGDNPYVTVADLGAMAGGLPTPVEGQYLKTVSGVWVPAGVASGDVSGLSAAIDARIPPAPYDLRQGAVLPYVVEAQIGGGTATNTWPAANRSYGVRYIIPADGVLDDVSIFYVGGADSHYDLAIFDDGAATAGSRTVLWHKGSTALALATDALQWFSSNPNLSVTRGQHIGVAMGVDNATGQFVKYGNHPSGNMADLPAAYMASPNTSQNWTNWQRSTSYPLPAVGSTYTEASLSNSNIIPQILVHVTPS